MAIQREFLGWDTPCLHTAATWLIGQYPAHPEYDLSGVLVVVPGRRSGRRLLEILVEKTHGFPFTPPLMKTTGELPEQLYTPAPPVAEPLWALLARIKSLQEADTDLLQTIVPQRPPPGDLRAWIQLAQDLAALDEELGAGVIAIKDVTPRCEAETDFIDHARWQALTKLHHRYEQTLARHNLQDRHTARLHATRRGRCRCPYDIVLIATVDLHTITKQMLTQTDTRTLTTLIHAPESHAENFDEYGCVLTPRWIDHRLNLDPAMVRVVDRPHDQAHGVLRALVDLGQDRFAADQITVGLGDEAMGPGIERQLESAGVPARAAAGKPVSHSRPVMLLSALERYFKDTTPRFDHFASLLRHPDLESHLTQEPGSAGHPTNTQATRSAIAQWLSLLDRYATDYLQSRLTDPWLGRPQSSQSLKAVHDRVAGLLGDQPHQPKPLAQWSEPLSEALNTVYSHRKLDRHRREDADLIHALEAIGRVLREQAQLPHDNTLAPRLTASQAITFTLARLRGQEIPPEGGRPAVELLGWLELPLDDAPVLIVTGFNEGHIPRSANADAFLPNHTRGLLGLEDNRRRYARDLMLLTAMIASHEHVTLIAGRRDANGNPLAPSRLLLACDEDRLADAIERFYKPSKQNTPNPVPPIEPGTQNRFTIPPPQPQAPITELHVTAFRDYLACPYRFYLKHVQKLETLDDRANEMDGGTFGSLIHDVLKQFGGSDLADSTHETQIQRYLVEQLNNLTRRRFGGHPTAAVAIQCEWLRRRLMAFARWQARQAQEGWRIISEHIEMKLSATIDVDGSPFTIIGRIDRIDRHPEHGYRILDYKTGDNAKKPDEVHRRGRKGNKQWVDLQLPLYRSLVGTLGIQDPVAMGFVQLPKDTPKLDPANWSDDELDSAMEEARRVIRAIRSGHFWPPAYPPPPFSDGFAAICMDGCPDRTQAITQAHPLASKRGQP